MTCMVILHVIYYRSQVCDFSHYDTDFFQPGAMGTHYRPVWECL